MIKRCRGKVYALGEVREKESVIDRLATAEMKHRSGKSREKSVEQNL